MQSREDIQLAADSCKHCSKTFVKHNKTYKRHTTYSTVLGRPISDFLDNEENSLDKSFVCDVCFRMFKRAITANDELQKRKTVTSASTKNMTNRDNVLFSQSWGETLKLQKSALRWDIKRAMKSLCTKLSELGEECFVATINVSNGWVGHIGTIRGEEFVDERSQILYDFLDYCCESIGVTAHADSDQGSESPDDEDTVSLSTNPDQNPPDGLEPVRICNTPSTIRTGPASDSEDSLLISMPFRKTNVTDIGESGSNVDAEASHPKKMKTMKHSVSILSKAKPKGLPSSGYIEDLNQDSPNSSHIDQPKTALETLKRKRQISLFNVTKMAPTSDSRPVDNSSDKIGAKQQEQIKCYVCLKEFADEQNFKKHLIFKKHWLSRYGELCSKCGVSGFTASQMDLHTIYCK